MEINFPAVGSLQESKLARRIEPRHRPCGLLLMMLYLALSASCLILKLTTGMPKGVVDGKGQIGMTCVLGRRPPYIDFAAVRQRKTNVDLIKSALAMVLTRPLHHDPTRRYAPPALLKLVDVLGDGILNLRRARSALKIDLRRDLHLVFSALASIT